MLHIYGIYGSFFSWVDRPTSASFCTSPIQRDHMYVWRYGDDLQMGERFPTRRGEASWGPWVACKHGIHSAQVHQPGHSAWDFFRRLFGACVLA